ncbi:hypothetical protein [Metaclostridioides mangenotii]|uniref:hypothetical protein n=1 Tax=Metaclostridioides mangenotii TaxID=1540 RepID=UPI0004648018|nr:hypothetical protein [Clostridioides mangenotii]
MISEIKQRIELKNGDVFWTGDIVKIVSEEYEGYSSYKKNRIEYVGKIIDADEFGIRLDGSDKFKASTVSIQALDMISMDLFE